MSSSSPEQCLRKSHGEWQCKSRPVWRRHAQSRSLRFLAIVAAARCAKSVSQLLRPVLERRLDIVHGIEGAGEFLAPNAAIDGSCQQLAGRPVRDLGLCLRLADKARLAGDQAFRLGNGEAERE